MNGFLYNQSPQTHVFQQNGDANGQYSQSDTQRMQQQYMQQMQQTNARQYGGPQTQRSAMPLQSNDGMMRSMSPGPRSNSMLSSQGSPASAQYPLAMTANPVYPQSSQGNTIYDARRMAAIQAQSQASPRPSSAASLTPQSAFPPGYHPQSNPFSAPGPSQSALMPSYASSNSGSPASHPSPTPVKQNSVSLIQPNPVSQTSTTGPTPYMDPGVFVNKLIQHLQSIGKEFQPPPPIEGRSIDLTRMFQCVLSVGGLASVNARRLWPLIASNLGFQSMSAAVPTHPPERIQALQDIYKSLLLSFEMKILQSAGRTPDQQPINHSAAPSPAPQLDNNSRKSSIDLKQKAKQLGTPPQAKTLVKEVSSLTDTKPPVMPEPQANMTAGPSLPTANGTATKSEDAKSAVSPTRKRRRQQIQYVPYAKPADSFGGYPGSTLESYKARTKQKRRRTIQDLGVVDLHTVVMSLQSGLPQEIVYGLNVLNLLAQHTRTTNKEAAGLTLPLAHLDDMLDVLLGLLADNAFVEATEESIAENKRSYPTSYRAHYALVQEENARRPARVCQLPKLALRPTDVVLNLVNLFRLFSQTPENLDSFAQNDKLLDMLLRICQFPAPLTESWTVVAIAFAQDEMLTIRKDVLVTLAELGCDIALEKLPPYAPRIIWQLVQFFWQDLCESDNPLQITSFPINSDIRSGCVNIYADTALTVLAQVAISDSNREVFSRAIRKGSEVMELFDSLVQCLPMSEEEWVTTLHPGNESGSLRMARLSCALFNVAFIASTEVKQKLRQRTGLARTIRRNLTRMAKVTAGRLNADHWAPYGRLLEVLLLISTESSENDTFDPTSSFFGGGFESDTAADPKTSKSLDMTRQISQDSERKIVSRAPMFYTELAMLADVTWTQTGAIFPPEIMALLTKLC